MRFQSTHDLPFNFKILVPLSEEWQKADPFAISAYSRASGRLVVHDGGAFGFVWGY